MYQSKLSQIRIAILEYLNGIEDSISIYRILIFYIQSNIIRLYTVKCTILNGFIFLGSIFFFENVVVKMIHLFGDILHLPTISKDIHDKTIRDLVDYFVIVLYQILWIYPIYCISFILNTIWYQEIADHAYLKQHGKPKQQSITNIIRDELYRTLLISCFLIQIMFFLFIPFVGSILAFFSLSWLYALYCFEYKWSAHGWTLEKKIYHLEKYWAYFAGFGSPFTLATFFMPNFVSKGIFALLFPMFLLLAICCEPRGTGHNIDLAIFRAARWLSLQILRTCNKWSKIRKYQQ